MGGLRSMGTVIFVFVSDGKKFLHDGDGKFFFLTVREMAKFFFSRDRGIGVFWIPFTRNA